MASSTSRFTLRARAVGFGMVAVGAIAAGARAQSTTAAQPGMQPPPASQPPVQLPGAITSSSQIPLDSLAAMTPAPMPKPAAAAPATNPHEVAAGTAAWPVDPATGMTMINGQPVVGRVFIMRKTDGLRKYDGVANHYVNEPLRPEPAIVNTRHIQPPPQAARRLRTIMSQATLWANEKYPRTEQRHYRPMTTTGELERR